MKSRSFLSNFLILSLGLPVATASGQDLVWDSDTGASGNWSTTDINWDSDSNGAADAGWTQNASAIFSEAAETVTVTTNNSFNSLTFGITGYTIAGGAGNLDIDSSDNASSITITNSGDTATINEVIRNNGGGTTAGALEKLGAGTLVLGGANGFSGGLTISAGTVTSTVASGFGTGTVSIGAAGTATVALGADVNVSNVFTGTGILTVSGSAGTPNLNNASALNGFTGTLNVNTSGGKKVALTTAGGKIGSGATVNIASGGTLYIGTTTASFDGVTFNVVGQGNTENFGAIRIENGSVIGASSSIVLGGNTSLGAQNGGAGTINAVISESTPSTLTKVGSQTLILGGANTYTGTTTISAGTLQLGSGGTTGSLSTSSAITNNATLAVNRSNAVAQGVDFNSVISGTGAFVQTGTGTTTLSGANTYTGGTRANLGILVLSGSHTKAAGTGDFISVNNVGAQNAVVKITSTAGTQAYRELNLAEATNARGAVYQEGGDFTTANIFRVAGGSGSYGYYRLSGGTVTNTAGDMLVGSGSGSTGVMEITSGSHSTGSWIVLGRNGGTASGLLNVTGGSLASNSNNIALNWGGSSGALSVLNVGGGAGAAAVTGVSNAANYLDVSVANVAGQTGVVNLRANGTLTVSQVRVGGASSTALFNFNGGTLKANAANDRQRSHLDWGGRWRWRLHRRPIGEDHRRHWQHGDWLRGDDRRWHRQRDLQGFLDHHHQCRLLYGRSHHCDPRWRWRFDCCYDRGDLDGCEHQRWHDVHRQRHTHPERCQYLHR